MGFFATVNRSLSADHFRRHFSTSGALWAGQAAAAITWVDSTIMNGTNDIGKLYQIMLAVREFNTCTGEWAVWSNPYVIESYTVVHTLPGRAHGDSSDPSCCSTYCGDRGCAITKQPIFSVGQLRGLRQSIGGESIANCSSLANVVEMYLAIFSTDAQ